MKQQQNRSEEKARHIPENDPSKAMDSKREVEQSPDEKTDQDFPGYPHYPAREDILNQRNDYIREDTNVENLPTSTNETGVSQRFAANSQSAHKQEEAGEDNSASQQGRGEP